MILNREYKARVSSLQINESFTSVPFLTTTSHRHGHNMAAGGSGGERKKEGRMEEEEEGGEKPCEAWSCLHREGGLPLRLSFHVCVRLNLLILSWLLFLVGCRSLGRRLSLHLDWASLLALSLLLSPFWTTFSFLFLCGPSPPQPPWLPYTPPNPPNHCFTDPGSH